MSKGKVLLVLALGILLLTYPMVSYATFSGVKFCLDPGHGGSDPGAVGLGLEEEDVNLDICLRARSLFQQDGATIVMTRTSDVYVSLQGRCDIANNNGCNRFICSHCNAFNGAAYGTETFCHPNGSSYSYDLRNKINPEMVSHMGTYNRGVKTADFYVLRNTVMPAILCEVGFIDNAGDNAKLASATYRQQAAKAYLHGTQSHYGMAPHDPVVAEIVIDNTSGAFSASAGWATGTSAADKYGADYRWRSTQAISDPAVWTPNIPSAGNYAVYAWWTAGANRSTAAPYLVYYNGGNANVKKNQQANGGKWNLLGTWNFAAGTGGSVRLSCWAPSGYVVVADAVKLVKQ